MKVLGRGWQYTTYDLGRNRVRKEYNSRLVGYMEILGAFLRHGTPLPWEIPSYFDDCKRKALVSMHEVKKGILEPWMMGNSNVIDELTYEQDKLTPLHEVLQNSTAEEIRNLIDTFVNFNRALVERGLIDKSFNIFKNFGLDAEGRVVLMDLGELYSDRTAIEEQLKKRMWASHYVANVIKDETLRAYYIEQMDKNFGRVN